MSETRELYVTASLLKSQENSGIMDTELDTLREHLPDLERLLLSLLVKVQVAQGKEPTLTRAERRKC